MHIRGLTKSLSEYVCDNVNPRCERVPRKEHPSKTQQRASERQYPRVKLKRGPVVTNGGFRSIIHTEQSYKKNISRCSRND